MVVDTGEESYPLYPDPAMIARGPASRRTKAELRSLAGVWCDLDADEMIEKLYRARREAPPSDPLEA